MRQALQKCWQHLEENRPKEALALLWELDREERDHPERLHLQAVLEALATVECWLGRLPLAERQAKRGIARALEAAGEGAPETVRAMLCLARVYWRQNRDAEALTIVEQATVAAGQELWHGAHRVLALQRCGQIREAVQAVLALDALARGRNRLSLDLVKCRLHRLDAHPEVSGQLLNQLSGALDDCPELLPFFFSERALLSLHLQRWEEAAFWAAKACHAGEQRANFCRLSAARLFEILAVAHLEMEQYDLAMATLNRAEETLRWQERLPSDGFFAPVLWPDAGGSLRGEAQPPLRPEAGSDLDWPLLWPSWSHQEQVQLWLDLAGRRARLFRRLGQEDAAKEVAGSLRAVRSTQGEARLGHKNPMMEETITIQAKFSGPARRPKRVGWESARGELEWVGEGQGSKVLALLGRERCLLNSDSHLFQEPMAQEPVELFLYARDARSSQKSAIPYTVWVTFATGPALRIPIQV